MKESINKPISIKHYVDNQFMWQQRIDILNAKLSSTEAKLREVAISGESKLTNALFEKVSAEFRAVREAVNVYNLDLEAWKLEHNEWRGQSKDREDKFATKVESEKDIHRVEQMQGDSSRRMDEKMEQLIKEMAVITKYMDTSRGGNKVWYILIGLASSLITAVVVLLINHYLKQS